MKNFKYTITDEVGIHARPAGILAKEAKKYSSKIVIVKGEKKAEVTKIMAVMALGVKCGEEIEVQVSGEDEDTTIVEIQKFFENNL